MKFKTLTISEDIYRKLLYIKKENESFDELLNRLARKNLEILKELRGCMEFKSKEEMMKEIYEKRAEKRI